MDLLWQNPNPTNAFGPQTIQVDLSGYQLFYLEYVHNKYSSIRMYGIFIKNTTTYLVAPESRTGLRTISFTDDGFTCGSGNWFQINGETGTNDLFCMPEKLYGLKGITIQ